MAWKLGLTAIAVALGLALNVVAVTYGRSAQQQGGVLGKPQLQPRAVTALAATCWTRPDDLVTAVAIEQAEAFGYVNARNDNHHQLGDAAVTVGELVLNAETLQRFTVVSKSSTGVVLRDQSGDTALYPLEALVVTSRDVGLWEISIPASQIGTQTERDLYVPANNVAAACELWKRRSFLPWVAYQRHIYLHDAYLQRATLGVANLLMARQLKIARSWGQTPKTRTPFISIPELRGLYPKVGL